VQAIRARRGDGKGAGRRADRLYLLARLAHCSKCRLQLTSQTSERKGLAAQYYLCPAKRRSVDCPAGGEFAPARAIDAQVAKLVSWLVLPEDWRGRLAELTEHREERENVEGKRRYLQGKLRRLRFLFLDEEDMNEGEYRRRKADLQAQLDALRTPETPEIEQAGETLESLGQEWAHAPKKYKHDMLRCIFEAIFRRGGPKVSLRQTLPTLCATFQNGWTGGKAFCLLRRSACGIIFASDSTNLGGTGAWKRRPGPENRLFF